MRFSLCAETDQGEQFNGRMVDLAALQHQRDDHADRAPHSRVPALAEDALAQQQPGQAAGRSLMPGRPRFRA